jgi:hypothetical protein
MTTLAKIMDASKIILARAGDVTSTRDPTTGDPHELILCLQLKTIDVYDFHVPFAEVIDEAKGQASNGRGLRVKSGQIPWPHALRKGQGLCSMRRPSFVRCGAQPKPLSRSSRRITHTSGSRACGARTPRRYQR